MKNGHKICLNYKDLPQLVKKYHRNKKKIVLTQGTFDMIHVGHARYLDQAKTHGDVLFVGVDSDEKTKARKGPDRPIVPQEERLEMLTYFSSVDHVILKEVEKEKWELIKILRPDVLIATKKTYTKKQLEQLKEYCGKVVVLQPMATTSTSAKIRLVQLGMAKKMTATLSEKLIKAAEEILNELKD